MIKLQGVGDSVLGSVLNSVKESSFSSFADSVWYQVHYCNRKFNIILNSVYKPIARNVQKDLLQ